jgi:hypothetical protein
MEANPFMEYRKNLRISILFCVDLTWIYPTFLFLHAISHKRFEALQKHFDTHGLLPRVHGNMKRLPPNTRPPEDTIRALGFIDNFSEIHGIPLPGRMPNHQDSDLVLLPSDKSKSYVYRLYADACEESGTSRVGSLRNCGMIYIHM